MASIAKRERFVHLGLGVHRDTIVAGILRPSSDTVIVEQLFHDEPSVRRFIGGFPDRQRLWVGYEAGPTGYGGARLLAAMGVRCAVVAPSVIPRAAGERVKTDKRDCRRLARLHRAGELVAIRVPTPQALGSQGLV